VPFRVCSFGTFAVAWTQCTDANRARAPTQVPSESSHRTRSIAAMTAGSSGSSPSACNASRSSSSTPVLDVRPDPIPTGVAVDTAGNVYVTDFYNLP